MSAPQTLRATGVSAARDYQQLPAWQKAIALAEHVFTISEHFPAREHAGLAAAMRATALAIAASIAAASGRNNEFGMTDSYSKAQSSTAELSTQAIIATRLDYIDSVVAAKTVELIEEVSRLIVALKHGLKVAAKDAERAEREAAAAERAEREERSERPRREFKPREERGGRGGEDRPRREFKPRDGGEDRPRREYKPRDGGSDRPREYKPREERGGDRKPYGEKKSYGDKKKPYGDKKYGDKKPYGDRKPRGDKPFRKPRD